MDIPASFPTRSSANSRTFENRNDVLCVTALLALALTAAALWMPYSIYRLDNLAFYLPWYQHLGERLRDFDIPGWMPNVFSGTPFAGDPQSGWGYLPAMVIMTTVPSLTGFKLFLTFHILLAALGSYVFIRNLGMAPIAALGGACVFTFGNFLERTSCCAIHMQVTVWIPVVFLLIDQTLQTSDARHRWVYAVLGGLAVSQMFAGWIGQGAYYAGLATAIYLVYRLIGLCRSNRRVPWLRIGLAGMLAAVTAGCMVATAVLPRLTVISRSNLASLYESGAASSGDSGWAVWQLVNRFTGVMVREGRWYLGMAGLAAIFIAWPLLGRRKDVPFFSLYSVGVLAMILRHSPVTWLFDQLPRFQSLHNHSPDRILIVFFIGPAVLTAAIIDAALDRSWKPPPIGRRIAAPTLPLMLFGAGVIWVQRVSADWIPWSRLLLVLLTCAGVGLAMIRPRPILVRLGVLLLLMVVLYDPAARIALDRHNDSVAADLASEITEANTQPTAGAAWLRSKLQTEGPFRFFGYDVSILTGPSGRSTYVNAHYDLATANLLVNNRSIRLGLEDIQGYNPVQLRRYVAFIGTMNGETQSYHLATVLEGGITSSLLNLLSVRYVVVPVNVPPDRPDLLNLAARYPTVYSDADIRILENMQALPRVWLVHAAQTVTSDQVLPKIQLGEIDPGKVALLETTAPKLRQPDDSSAETVSIDRMSDDEIRLSVTVTERALVMLSEVWDPGWSASLDGDAVRIYRADYLLRALLVNPGRHEIDLRFRATDVRNTLLLWSIPLPLLAAILIAEYVLQRRRAAAAPLPTVTKPTP
jgi:hypothetical protein